MFYKTCILFLTLLLTGALFTHAQDTFQLEGRVLQGTAAGEPLPESLPLQLRILNPTGEVFETMSAATRSDGGFTFTDVPHYENRFYVVVTFWAGIEQSSTPLKYEEIEGTIDFPLYEISDSLSDVVANRGNLRIDFANVEDINAVQVLLELNYANLGDHIVLANANTDAASAFTIELPVGAFGIAPEEAPGSVQRFQDVSQVGDLPIPGIRDTQPLVPNWPNVMRVSFLVPYDDGAVFDLRFPFAVSDLAVFVREGSFTINSDFLKLAEQAQETSFGNVYQVYEQVEPLNPNQPFKFTLLGQAAPSQPTVVSHATESSSTTLIIMLILGVLIIVAALVFWLLWARQVERT